MRNVWFNQDNGRISVEDVADDGVVWRATISPGQEQHAREVLGVAAEELIARWTPEQIAAARPPELATPTTPNVPPVVSAFQARAALRRAGLLSIVEAAVASHPDAEAQDAWEYAIEVRRNSPLVISLVTSLGLTEEQVDSLFITAASIEV